jgi:hypothetical protein
MTIYYPYFYKPRYRTYGLGFGGLMVVLVWAILMNIVGNVFVLVWDIIAVLWLVLFKVPRALINGHRVRVRKNKLDDATGEYLDYQKDREKPFDTRSDWRRW